MNWSHRLSLLTTFCGSFILFWIAYYFITVSAGLLAIGSEGSGTPLFFRVMELLARIGAAATGSLKQDTAIFRATTLYALIFSLVRTIRAQKKIQKMTEKSQRDEIF